MEIEYNPRIYKFSYKSEELDLLKEINERVKSYNKQQDFHYSLKLLTNRRRFDLWSIGVGKKNGNQN